MARSGVWAIRRSSSRARCSRSATPEYSARPTSRRTRSATGSKRAMTATRDNAATKGTSSASRWRTKASRPTTATVTPTMPSPMTIEYRNARPATVGARNTPWANTAYAAMTRAHAIRTMPIHGSDGAAWDTIRSAPPIDPSTTVARAASSCWRRARSTEAARRGAAIQAAARASIASRAVIQIHPKTSPLTDPQLKWGGASCHAWSGATRATSGHDDRDGVRDRDRDRWTGRRGPSPLNTTATCRVTAGTSDPAAFSSRPSWSATAGSEVRCWIRIEADQVASRAHRRAKALAAGTRRARVITVSPSQMASTAVVPWAASSSDSAVDELLRERVPNRSLRLGPGTGKVCRKRLFRCDR